MSNHTPIFHVNKICTHCRNKFPATTVYFFRNCHSIDGLQHVCKTCARLVNREYYKQHAEKIKHDTRQYRISHKEEGREKNNRRSREWAARNPERAQRKSRLNHEKHRGREREQARQWYYNNRERVSEQVKTESGRLIRRLIGLRRRSRIKSLPNDFTERDWSFALDYWSGCAICGEKANLHADHWIPIANESCPGTVPENIVVLCARCNQSKNSSNPVEWLINRFGEKWARIKLEDINRFFEVVRRR